MVVAAYVLCRDSEAVLWELTSRVCISSLVGCGSGPELFAQTVGVKFASESSLGIRWSGRERMPAFLF